VAMALKRALTKRHVFAVAAGAMISSGLFVLPYKLVSPDDLGVGSGLPLCYLGALILLVPAVVTMAELMTAMPKAGGSFYFIDRSLGPGFGTVGGVASWAALAFKSAFAVVGIALLVGQYAQSTGMAGWADDSWQVKAVACGFCALFALLNILGVKLAGRVQFLLVVAMLAILWAFVAFGMRTVEWGRFAIPREGALQSFPRVLRGMAAVFIAFGGVTKVATLGEEVRDPKRDLVRGMFIACVAVGLLYVLVTGVATGVLPEDGAQWSHTPLAQAAGTFWGGGGELVLMLAAIFAFVTTGNAGVLSASRIIMAISRDGLLPRSLGQVSEAGTPVRAIVFTALFMAATIVFLDLYVFVKAASAIMIMVFMFVMLALVLMRESRLPSYKPAWCSPWYPWMQVVGMVAYAFLLVELGTVALAVAGVIIGGALAWYLFYARVTVMRESALVRVAARLAKLDFQDHDLESELSRVVRERDRVVGDRFDSYLENCPALDLPEGAGIEEMFDRVCAELAQRVRLTADEIKELFQRREDLSSTVVRPGLAIPHIISDALESFHVVLVRSRSGVQFDQAEQPVHIMFVIAAPPSERNFYLRTLMAIAEIAQEPDFDQRWMRARGPEGLREVMLSGERRRDEEPDDESR
jgi:amino acid transporter/mannitol/fructose-specific phosphotransferase system IIA component (Ntr-type)